MASVTRPLIAIALSGGVDSAVSAALLQREGFAVIGLTMRLLDNADSVISDAARVAEALDIPHHVIDLRAVFQSQVLKPFADDYAGGRTPLPCARCNRHVKLGALFQSALDLGATALATGHYARIEDTPDGVGLFRATDLRRDQSYFLFDVPCDHFARLRFPLGGFAGKSETRALAREFGLPVHEKPDSQDLCFAARGTHEEVVLKLRPDASRSGPIVNRTGEVLGRHSGLLHYTIGQRRGLGLGGGSGEPVFVTDLKPDETGGGVVVVGPNEDLACVEFQVTDLNWLSGDRDAKPSDMRAQIKIRALSRMIPGTVFPDGDSGAVVRLDEPAYGVAPGQAAVFYDAESGQQVLGGGWIRRLPD